MRKELAKKFGKYGYEVENIVNLGCSSHPSDPLPYLFPIFSNGLKKNDRNPSKKPCWNPNVSLSAEESSKPFLWLLPCLLAVPTDL